MSALRTNITLPQAIVNRLHMSVPQGQRSKFITQAVAEKLGREKTKEDAFKLSLQANAALYKREAETWNITETESWPE